MTTRQNRRASKRRRVKTKTTTRQNKNGESSKQKRERVKTKMSDRQKKNALPSKRITLTTSRISPAHRPLRGPSAVHTQMRASHPPSSVLVTRKPIAQQTAEHTASNPLACQSNRSA